MRVYCTLTDIEHPDPSAVTVGTFDGFHLGHQAIISRLKEVARGNGLSTTVVTFDPHPRKVVGNPHNHPIRLLTTTEEKLRLFEQTGVDQVVIIPFTREFAALSAEEFIRQVLLERLKAREIVIGYDHHFGRRREGSFELLKALGDQMGFGVHQVPPLVLNGQAVSSSMIRQLVEAGKVEEAARWMGRPYALAGMVERGAGRGRQIGFPTANIRVDDEDKLIPARGVYAVDMVVEGKVRPGMMNIGVRPTFGFDALTLEVHVFNFNAWLYDKRVEVRFKKFIRPERKFSDIEELKAQLEKDKQICEKV
ncbi:MAG: bifunctional riboflavin kinase/FAD synthetase [Calditrichaeota bacterium]|nr:MAG: bifunctional riboflavin kinase/FAD synthetase [Calditrichota bacterium]